MELIWDGDCGFCARSLGWMRDLGCTIPARPWQQVPDLAALGLTEAEVGESVWVLDGQRRYAGAAAIAMALGTSRHRAVRALAPVVRRAPGSEAAYRVVARNRHRLPGASGACALPDQPGPPDESPRSTPR